jgi:hypothetical protein
MLYPAELHCLNWWARSELNRLPNRYERFARPLSFRPLLKMVPKIGLEPTRLYSRNILSVVRLPISPRRLSVRESTAKRNPYPHYQPPLRRGITNSIIKYDMVKQYQIISLAILLVRSLWLLGTFMFSLLSCFPYFIDNPMQKRNVPVVIISTALC